MNSKLFQPAMATAMLLSLLSSPAWAKPVISAELEASPDSVSTKCPATIHFKGKIKSTTGGIVKYQFFRNDGGKGPIESVNFSAPGTKAISTTWQIGQSYTGWEAVRILSPVVAESNKAKFTLKCTGTGGHGPGPVAPSISAHLEATPNVVDAKCPATVNFKGHIKSTVGGIVKYQFFRNDGAKGPIESVNFSAPGVKAISTTWQLGMSYSGWEAVRIISPIPTESNKANFKLHCKGVAPAPVAKPNITLIRPYGVCKKKGMELYIVGTNFGANPGVLNANVAIAGQGIHVILIVNSWTNTMIRATIPNSPQIINGKTYYVALHKNAPSLWLSNFYQPITMCK